MLQHEPHIRIRDIGNGFHHSHQRRCIPLDIHEADAQLHDLVRPETQRSGIPRYLIEPDTQSYRGDRTISPYTRAIRKLFRLSSTRAHSPIKRMMFEDEESIFREQSTDRLRWSLLQIPSTAQVLDLATAFLHTCPPCDSALLGNLARYWGRD
jgi:hypothetical protein